MTKVYKGFTLSQNGDWVVITDISGVIKGKVPDFGEAQYWVDLYLQQNP